MLRGALATGPWHEIGDVKQVLLCTCQHGSNTKREHCAAVQQESTSDTHTHTDPLPHNDVRRGTVLLEGTVLKPATRKPSVRTKEPIVNSRENDPGTYTSRFERIGCSFRASDLCAGAPQRVAPCCTSTRRTCVSLQVKPHAQSPQRMNFKTASK